MLPSIADPKPSMASVDHTSLTNFEVQWVVATSFGWATISVLGDAGLEGFVVGPNQRWGLELAYMSAAGAVGGLVAGIVTGIPLPWLLRPSVGRRPPLVPVTAA